MEGTEKRKSWKIDNEARAAALKEWLDYQIALREELIEESEFDSGISSPCPMTIGLLGDVKKSLEISGLKNVARILGENLQTINNTDTGGMMYTLMYGDCMLYDRLGNS